MSLLVESCKTLRQRAQDNSILYARAQSPISGTKKYGSKADWQNAGTHYLETGRLFAGLDDHRDLHDELHPDAAYQLV